jgi:hypothetical protein
MKPNTNYVTDEDLLKIAQDKKSALQFRQRKHEDWTDNYTLQRDKVITNRLTQRQSVNIPLMRYALSTMMKDISDPPMLYFKNLDNDQQKEIFYNEYWNKMSEVNKLPVRDRVDKKQALLFGRSFKKLNIKDGMFRFEIIDPQDMLVERHVDPADLDSARCIIQTGIYRTLSEIEANEQFNTQVVKDLKNYCSRTSTSEEAEHNFHQLADKQERMSNMGLIDAFDPLVGETYVELQEVYRKEYNSKLKDTEVILYIVASTDGGMFKLYKKPLHEVIGETDDDYWFNHYPYTSWGVDMERTDFWSDGPADTVRQVNKVLNSWASQLVENRTLRNLNMHYYDSSNVNFVPQTFQPVAWGWYPTPGDPNAMIKDVVVGDLADSLNEMQFMISIAEKAIAVTGQTGEMPNGARTLGQVQIEVSNAIDRVKTLVVFYHEDWKNFGTKYIKFLDASSDSIDAIKVFKKGRVTSNMFSKEISPDGWMTKSGYTVEVKLKSDKQTEDMDKLQKMNIAVAAMPDNQPLQDLYKKTLIEFIPDVTADEEKEIMDFEKQKQLSVGADMGTMPGQTPQALPQASPQPAPVNPVNNVANVQK